MLPHTRGQRKAKGSIGKESKSPKSESKPSPKKPETTSSQSDFQPPSSQLPRSSKAKNFITRMPTSAEAQAPYQHETDGDSKRRALDSTPARNNVSSAHRAHGSQKSSKTSKISANTPINMDPADGHHDPFQSSELWEGPLGSFGENDSPPRAYPSGRHDNRSSSMYPSPRGSPPLRPHQYMHYSDYSTPYGQDREWHRKNVTGSYPAHGQQHGRPYHLGHHSSFYDSDPVWNSPPPMDESFATSGRTSPLTRPDRSGVTMTPNKKSKSNPFRSPASKSFCRSPFRVSPHLGLSSSFGMVETPDPQLADAFSPVGPSFVYFERTGDEPRPRLSLTRSSSGEIEAPPMPQRSSAKDSPFTGFLNEFINAPSSAALQGVARSPVRKATKLSASRSASSSASRITATTSLQASPVLPSSEVKPTKLWNDGSASRHMPPAPRNAMRLELGQLGAKSSRTQQSFEGINSMMRASGAAHHSAQAYRSPFVPHMYGQSHHQSNRYASQPAPFQSSQPASTPKSSQTSNISSASTPAVAPKLIPPSTVKPSQKQPNAEESSTKDSDSEKRTCNCRKSKCLKLYCDCFSAKVYCDGCKCIDCKNLPQFDDLREKAIQNARTKNPMAFQQSTGGCRCKRSACLKKYCECFHAGEFCGPSCKCVDCENRAGSQKLIDKRRKMKDSKGAEYAVRVAHEVWQGQRSQQGSTASPANVVHTNMPPGSVHGRHHPHHMPPGGMPHRGYMHPGFMAPPVMGHLGYSPMGVPPVTPLYGQHRAHEMHMRGMMHHYNAEEHQTKSTEVKSAPSSKKRPLPDTSPPTISKAPAPRTPPVRIEFDPLSSRKKCNKTNAPEEMLAIFGENKPLQPKCAVLNVFSFLSNADIYSAAIVSKEWSRIAMDRELWEFSD